MGLDHPGFQKPSQLPEVKCQDVIRSDECSQEACKYQELLCFLAPWSLRISMVLKEIDRSYFLRCASRIHAFDICRQ